jgi:hypothetical protein
MAGYYKSKILRRGSRYFYKQLSNLLDKIDIDFYILRHFGDKEDVFQGFVIILMVFAGLGVTGFFLFEILAGLLFILFGFIYYPIQNLENFIEGNSKAKEKGLLFNLPSIEFALCFTVGFGMIVDAFNTPKIEKEDVKKKEEKNVDHPVKNAKKVKKD